MEHLRKFLFLLCACGLLPSCGVHADRTKGMPPQAQAQFSKDGLKGIITLLDGTKLDLSREEQPFVLTFAGYTCQTCRQEAKAHAAHFAQKGGLPKEVKLITVITMVGSERAVKWQQQTGLKGIVGYQEERGLFQELCPDELTPCVFSQNLRGDPKVKKYTESPTLELLERDTGPWTF